MSDNLYKTLVLFILCAVLMAIILKNNDSQIGRYVQGVSPGAILDTKTGTLHTPNGYTEIVKKSKEIGVWKKRSISN